MPRGSHEEFRVYLVEKLIINFALPSDFVYHTFRALFAGDRSQGVVERIGGIWDGKVRKYQKLLRVKAENDGRIPDEYRDLCKRTPCGYVRLLMAHIRWVSHHRREKAEQRASESVASATTSGAAGKSA